MGEIAEMMLEGTLCEGCGEYMGEGDGYPRRCSGCGGSPKPSRNQERGADKDYSEHFEPKIPAWGKVANSFGCSIAKSPHKFEIAVIRGNGVRLCIYPHRTSAGKYRARIRDQSSTDPALALKIIEALGLWCKSAPRGAR